MTRQANSLFVRPHDGQKGGGAGKREQYPPHHRMRGGDLPRGSMPCGPGHAGRYVLARGMFLVVFLSCAMTFAQSMGIIARTSVAYAAQTIKFENGGTAKLNDDGTITGTCDLRATWIGLDTVFTLTMPDGQSISARCLDYGLMAPADDSYDFTATPNGDGTYDVLCHSDRALYFQSIDNPRENAAGVGVQRTGSEPWRPQVVRGGMARVKKTSSASSITADLDTYSLEGAKFSVWRDAACTQSVSDAVLTTKEDGTTTPVNLEAGTYWLREDKAPRGFELDQTPHRFVVTAGETTYVELSDEPIWQTPSVIVSKVDASTGHGGAGLGGAEFEIRYYDGSYKKDTLPSKATRTWVMKSSDDGTVPWATSAKVRGDAFYLHDGKPVIPLGTIAIQELKAPSGYYLEGQTASSPSGYEAPVHVISIQGSTVYVAPTIADMMQRAGISLQKEDTQTGAKAQGDATLAGIKFQIVNSNQTSVVVDGTTYGPGQAIATPLVTDEHGRASTSKNYLPLGTYEIRELSTNDSYRNTSKAQRVTLKAANTNTMVEMDTPFADEVVRGGVRVVKSDADLGRTEPQGDASLEGATFSVTLESSSPVVVGGSTYTKGQVVATMKTDESGRAQTGARDLPYGTYTVRETKAPKGYQINDSYQQTFTIRSDGKVVDLASYSCAENVVRGGVRLGKIDHELSEGGSQGDATIAGAEFSVYLSSAHPVVVNGIECAPGTVVQTLVTGEDGIVASNPRSLPYGTYVIRETRAPEGYLLNEDFEREFVVREDGKVEDLGADACVDDVVRGGVRVVKRDADLGRAEPQGDASLEGATFSVTLESSRPVVVGGSSYTKGQVVATMRTDESGRAQTGARDLPYGTYTVRETKAPDGYLLNTDYQQTFSIREGNEFIDLSEYVCDEPVIRGGVRLGKIDRDRKMAAAQGDATLAGAEFSVYLSSAHPVVVNGIECAPGTVVQTLVTGEDGTAASGDHDLPYGTYVIRETHAPEGYLLNEDFEREFVVRADGKVEDLGAHACEDAVIRGGIAVGKVSRETSKHVGQGEATLKGAQLTIELSSAQPVVVAGNTYEPGSVVHTLTTDENGYACTDKRLLPYGTYTVREVEAPAGFLLNEDWSRTVYIREDGVICDISDEANSVDDQVMRGGFGFNKVEEDSMERMGSTVFRITSMTTGESHIAVTDENGLFHTETFKHSKQTNLNDEAVGTEDAVTEELLTPDAGIWFSGRTDMTTEPKDEFGALPYDVYEVRELRTKTNEGKRLVEFTVRIHSHEYVADMGTVDNKDTPTPDIATTLTYDDTQHVAPASERVTLVDTVRYEGLKPGETYEVIGELMSKETGELLRDAEGSAITATNTITPTTASGQTSVIFVFDATSLAGTTTVAFEHLMKDGHEVATHADLEDEAQTVRFPSLGTTLTDDAGNHEVGTGTERLLLIDSVSYTNLEPGRHYVMYGTLMDKGTGEPVLDANGNEVCSNTSFVPEEANGTVDVPFSLTSELVAGKTLVAFEYVKRQDVTLAEHADLEDEGQTITMPSIQTELTDEAGNHLASTTGIITLVDTVTYTNLIPGKTYEVRGIVMDKSTGEPLRDGEGQTFEASTTFVAENAEGTAQVHFAIDASLVVGREVVAFESLLREGRELAIHADIDDESQTVRVPSIGTTLTGVGGEHEVVASSAVELTDAVAYHGLTPHAAYRMVGRLMDAETGEALKKADGSDVTSECVFETDATDGLVSVTFVLDAADLAGKTVVCFETLWEGDGEDGRELVKHEDLADTAQTVTFPSIATHASDAEDGDNHVAGVGTVRIADEVSYANLRPGVEYVMRGTLHNKQTGEGLVNKDGSPVCAEVAFTPTEPSGVVSLVFELDASLVQGTAVVAFESCLRDGVEVAVHADIDDEEQTVYVARISTVATGKGNGTHEVDASEKVQIVDTVTYSGLVPGRTYRLEGTLYDKATGSPVMDAYDKPVKASGEFVPKEESGSVNLTFEFDASKLGGVTVVAFERLSDGTLLVATHEDINDEAQSVLIKKPEDKKQEDKPGTKVQGSTGSSAGDARSSASKSSTPRTGDLLVSPVTLACGGTLLMGVGMLRVWTRRKR